MYKSKLTKLHSLYYYLFNVPNYNKENGILQYLCKKIWFSLSEETIYFCTGHYKVKYKMQHKLFHSMRKYATSP